MGSRTPHWSTPTRTERPPVQRAEARSQCPAATSRQRVDRPSLVVARRCRAGQMCDGVDRTDHRDPDRDTAFHEMEPRETEQVRNVLQRASGEVVDTAHLVPTGDEGVAQMGTEETGSPVTAMRILTRHRQWLNREGSKRRRALGAGPSLAPPPAGEAIDSPCSPWQHSSPPDPRPPSGGRGSHYSSVRVTALPTGIRRPPSQTTETSPKAGMVVRTVSPPSVPGVRRRPQ